MFSFSHPLTKVFNLLLIRVPCHGPPLEDMFTTCLHGNEPFCHLRLISRFNTYKPPPKPPSPAAGCSGKMVKSASCDNRRLLMNHISNKIKWHKIACVLKHSVNLDCAYYCIPVEYVQSAILYNKHNKLRKSWIWVVRKDGGEQGAAAGKGFNLCRPSAQTLTVSLSPFFDKNRVGL